MTGFKNVVTVLARINKGETMNRVASVVFRAAIATTILFFGVIQLQIHAQTPAPASSPAAQAPAKEAAEEDANPFAPEPAAPLPPGMAGAVVYRPRWKLAPRLDDAGAAVWST